MRGGTQKRCFLPFQLLFLTCLVACGEEFTPKPRGYARMSLPRPQYQCLLDTFPYTFEHSVHARVRPDSSWIAEPYWIHISYPNPLAFLQLTYKPIDKRRELLTEYLEDTYRLASKHQIKAYSIEEIKVSFPVGEASFIELRGDVPTPLQFHITDSVNHFLRGAVYFNTALKNDSLAPAIDYLRKDVTHLLQTLRWK